MTEGGMLAWLEAHPDIWSTYHGYYTNLRMEGRSQDEAISLVAAAMADDIGPDWDAVARAITEG